MLNRFAQNFRSGYLQNKSKGFLQNSQNRTVIFGGTKMFFSNMYIFGPNTNQTLQCTQYTIYSSQKNQSQCTLQNTQWKMHNTQTQCTEFTMFTSFSFMISIDHKTWMWLLLKQIMFAEYTYDWSGILVKGKPKSSRLITSFVKNTFDING